MKFFFLGSQFSREQNVLLISQDDLVLTPYFAYLSDKVSVVTSKTNCGTYQFLARSSQNIRGKIKHFYEEDDKLFDVLSHIHENYEEFADYSFVISFGDLAELDAKEILADYCAEDAILLILDPWEGFYKCMFKNGYFSTQTLAEPNDILYK